MTLTEEWSLPMRDKFKVGDWVRVIGPDMVHNTNCIGMVGRVDHYVKDGRYAIADKNGLYSWYFQRINLIRVCKNALERK